MIFKQKIFFFFVGFLDFLPLENLNFLTKKNTQKWLKPVFERKTPCWGHPQTCWGHPNPIW